MNSNQQPRNSLRAADSALLLRARRLAKRTRAEAACQLCKRSKLKCSDYRPCARCKKSGVATCMDLQYSAQSTPDAISNALASRNCTTASRIADLTYRACGGNVSPPKNQTATHPPQSPSSMDDTLRLNLSAAWTPPIPPIPFLPIKFPAPCAPLEQMLAEAVDLAEDEQVIDEKGS